MNKLKREHIAKILKALDGHLAFIELNGRKEIILKDRATMATLTKATQEQLSHMASQGLLIYRGQDIALTREAQSFLARHASLEDGFQNQHRRTDKIELGQASSTTVLMQNIEESPILALYRRKTKTGASFLTDEEFRAGERLRRDFTFGALMPSVTMNWKENSGGTRNATACAMSDETLAARQRVNKALKAVGADLGSILIDVCCFLKGMETLEKERQWPVRSAKVVLKTALATLDRHYNPEGKILPPQYQHIEAMELRTY